MRDQYRKRKNDYSCIIFLVNGSVMKQPYVNNIFKLALWLKGNNIEWKYINIYLRRKPYPNYIKRQYAETYIEATP